MNTFMETDSLQFVDVLLSGFSGIDQPDPTNTWKSDIKFDVFKKYVKDSENELADVMQKLTYEIEDIPTFEAIIGTSRPEQVGHRISI